MIIRHVYKDDRKNLGRIWYTESKRKKKPWNPLDPSTFLRPYGLHPWEQCFPPGYFHKYMKKTKSQKG